MELIFGYRRLMACKALGFEEIPARIIDIDADDPVTALRMEQAENEVRKDFTPSEKVEIARRIEEALAGRVGNPQLGKSLPNCDDKPQGKSADEALGKRHGNNQHGQKEDSLTLDTPQGRSDELAAEAVGWGKDTYRKAKAVVESAPPQREK